LRRFDATSVQIFVVWQANSQQLQYGARVPVRTSEGL
jgi:hypothetical protein